METLPGAICGITRKTTVYLPDDLKVAVEREAARSFLAERCETKSVLTLDKRHYSVLRPLQGGRFELLP